MIFKQGIAAYTVQPNGDFVLTHVPAHYSAIFFPATPDWGYQNCRTCVLCLEHRVPAGCAWRTCPRGDCSTRVPIDLACGLLFAVCGLWLCCLFLAACGLRLAIGAKQQSVWAYHLCRKPAKYQHKVGNILCNFKTPIYTRPKMDPRHATLREMGLRTEKSIALHLLQENTYESNLVSDIANAPYLRGNAGRTHLAPIPGFPPFVDDIYVYGRLLERDTVRVGNRVSCTTGEHGSAARIVSQISLFVRDVWPPGEHKHIHVSIANTVAVGSGTRIPQTIQGIEERDEGRLASTWAALHGGERAAAYFVAKLDVSELPIAALHAGLPALQRLLVANGIALYQVDYTQDLSGTLDRKALVQHLEEKHRFAYQG